MEHLFADRGVFVRHNESLFRRQISTVTTNLLPPQASDINYSRILKSDHNMSTMSYLEVHYGVCRPEKNGVTVRTNLAVLCPKM